MEEKYSNRYVRKAKARLQKSTLSNSRRYDSELLELLSLRRSSRIPAISEICFRNWGIYPISFSIPYDVPQLPQRNRDFLISPIEPRKPYEYESFDDYLATYSRSTYAITFKKGGWDCPRHLEIMSVGSIPFFPDSNQIPQYTMIHYPKEFLTRARTLGEIGYLPSSDIHQAIRQWAQNMMASTVMSNYLLDKVKRDFSSILYVDESLPNRADCLSLYSLIGLKKLFGNGVHELRKTYYIYSDDASDNSKLYGRGFGYTKTIKKEIRDEVDFPTLTTVDRYQEVFREYDLVIVGDMSRNSIAVRALESLKSKTAKIYLRGDDLAPSRKERQELATLSGIVFSREIY